MAIRDKIKAKFGRSKNSISTGEPIVTKTATGELHYTGRKDIEYYKPNEIPKSKYRGRVDPDHKDKLDAYSFGDAFGTLRRKTSTAFSGTFSPGGTKALSAAPSAAASRRPSITASHLHIGTSVSSGSGIGGSNTPSHTGGSMSSDKISEHSDSSSSSTSSAEHGGSTDLSKTITAKQDSPTSKVQHDSPFTVEELERAMTRATLRASVDFDIQTRVNPIAAS